MRLESIKLAGFKSFSQSVSLRLPSNQIGIVGPNGCGKSNVIDAIRWVLGESTASGLRGGSLVDVIFNGSEEQGPAGRASVEMTFTGNLGQLGEKYAKQPNIKIRRVLERDRDSRYYIDNQSCRRKDIADLFAGMGLTGKADYAIVTQGSVNHIAESKPEHIRSLLEEAADITNYLQKRKDTLARIKTTRFNLKQISASKTESLRRMRELEKQAADAKQVSGLREELKQLREQRTVAEYTELTQKRRGKEAKEEKVLQKLNAIKEEQAHLLGIKEQDEIGLGQADESIAKLNKSLTETAHTVGAGESKLEMLRNRLPERRNAIEELKKEAEQLETEMGVSKKELDSVLAKREEIRASVEEGGANKSDETNQRTQEESLESDLAKLNQRGEEITGKIIRLEADLDRCRSEEQKSGLRLRQLEETPKQEVIAGKENEIKDLLRKKTTSTRSIEEIKQGLAGLEERANAVGKTEEAAQDANRKTERELAKADATLESLRTAQEKEQKKRTQPDEMMQSLRTLLKEADNIKVRSGWEQALDLVAGHLLNAYKTDDMAKTLNTFREQSDLPLVLMGSKTASDSAVNKENRRETAADLISQGAVPTLLQHVYICENLEEAMRQRVNLKNYESVLTSRGDWLGKNWAILAGGWKSKQKSSGFLTDQKQLEEIETQRAQIFKRYQKQITELEVMRKEQGALRQQLQDARAKLDAESRLQAESMESLSRLQEQEARREERLRREGEDQRRRQEETARIDGERQQLVAEIKTLSQQVDDLREKSKLLKKEQEEATERLSGLRRQRSVEAEKESELQQEIKSLTERINSLQKSIGEHERNKQKFATDIASTEQKLIAETKEIERIDADTENKQTTRSEVEKKLETARTERDALATKIETTQKRLRQLEQETVGLERDIKDARELGKQLNLELTDLMDRNTQLTGSALEKKSKEMTGINLSALKTRERQVQSQLDRVGEVNQLALRDYETEKERLEKINTETEQINSALGDLHKAIKRIDRESRLRFDETINKVNKNFSSLFAGLSDGGKARLIEEKEEDEHKQAGVRIMVSPVGRRHTSISLLSGGEKSLVAIALIMAIFQLNPAPFCLMDEADAMLDDENVMRYNRMLNSMADKTQFILITHNKLTMESSRQLIGITMSEPGISRAVSVDLEKAMQMSEQENQRQTQEQG